MITIICHDAGCAEILASYVAQNNVDYQFVLEGPAIDVFSRRFGDMEISALRESINKCDWCLCATSSASDLEWNAIEIAKMEKKHFPKSRQQVFCNIIRGFFQITRVFQFFKKFDFFAK